MATNVLYYGDNLDILERYIPNASVDLVYLDPSERFANRYRLVILMAPVTPCTAPPMPDPAEESEWRKR
ncbi:MAG: hypothetical protein H0W81_12555 [Chloroflexi bacterium]|nr:hypothetical protein [Chloroflexota bacterium]